MTLHNLVADITPALGGHFDWVASCPVTACLWSKRGNDTNTLQSDWRRHARTHELKRNRR